MTIAPDPVRKAAPGRAEFIALMAMLTATVAFSIDAMLPALPDISAALSPDNRNAVQLVLTTFVLGMGLGTFVTGPLSDRFGRKPVVIGGSALYIVAAGLGAMAQDLELLLAARLVQGLGAAGPRVVAMAIIRDLYAGRGMAQIVSFVMIVFTLVPAIAPSIGAGMIALGGWRLVFASFAVFSAIGTLWLLIRLPETLPVAARRPLRLGALGGAVAEMFRHPVVRLSILVQTLCFAMLFALLSSTQQIFDLTFGRAETFPYWLGGIALVSSSASFLNAALVMRLGMRILITGMLVAQVLLSAAMIAVWMAGLPAGLTFAAFVIWQGSLFFQAGLTIGNLNAIAMEPMGHIAGMAASVIGGVATVFGVMLAVPLGLMFDGTPLPLAAGVLAMALLALALMARMAVLERRLTAVPG